MLLLCIGMPLWQVATLASPLDFSSYIREKEYYSSVFFFFLKLFIGSRSDRELRRRRRCREWRGRCRVFRRTFFHARCLFKAARGREVYAKKTHACFHESRGEAAAERFYTKFIFMKINQMCVWSSLQSSQRIIYNSAALQKVSPFSAPSCWNHWSWLSTHPRTRVTEQVDYQWLSKPHDCISVPDRCCCCTLTV